MDSGSSPDDALSDDALLWPEGTISASGTSEAYSRTSSLNYVCAVGFRKMSSLFSHLCSFDTNLLKPVYCLNFG